MMEEAARVNFNQEELHHDCGNNFAALNIGLSYGNGHTKPMHQNLGCHSNLANVLLGDRDIQ
jgi:hypothetical protein